mgnify:CR=1 FL=1
MCELVHSACRTEFRKTPSAATATISMPSFCTHKNAFSTYTKRPAKASRMIHAYVEVLRKRAPCGNLTLHYRMHLKVLNACRRPRPYNVVAFLQCIS